MMEYESELNSLGYLNFLKLHRDYLHELGYQTLKDAIQDKVLFSYYLMEIS
jgi:hypothetical protein